MGIMIYSCGYKSTLEYHYLYIYISIYVKQILLSFNNFKLNNNSKKKPNMHMTKFNYSFTWKFKRRVAKEILILVCSLITFIKI